MTAPLHPPGDALHVVLLDVDGTLIDSNDAHANVADLIRTARRNFATSPLSVRA